MLLAATALVGGSMVELASWLASLPLGQALRRLHWLAPWLQVVHILANGMILSAVVMIDMRLWGISRALASTAMARRFLPWIWGALALLTISGILLTLYTPRRSIADVTFQAKMVLMGLAIVVTGALLTVLPGGEESAPGTLPSRVVPRLFGTLTLVLWVAVTLAGRGRWFTLLLMR